MSYTGHLVPHLDLWVEFEAEVPAFGYRIYTIETMTDSAVTDGVEVDGRVIENAYYRVEMDDDGAVCSLLDKQLNRELVGPGPWRLNQFIYEQISSPGGRADTVVQRPASFDWDPGRAELTLSTPRAARVRIRHGCFGVSLVSTSSLANFPSIVQEVHLPDRIKRVDLTTRLVKAEVAATEAAYVAFPFALSPKRVQCDTSGGAFIPGAEQIRGTATDWYDLAHGVQLSDDEVSLTWLCAEAPLVEFGEMKTGKTPSTPILDHGLLFSYVLNNHWFTNFFARQGGEIVARFRLLSGAAAPLATLGQAGRELLAPLVVARLGARGARDAGLEVSESTLALGRAGFAEIVDGAVALDCVKPAHDGKGWIVRLHEVGGIAGQARLRLQWPCPVVATPCDLLERPLPGRSAAALEEGGVLTAGMVPFGTASWRLSPAE